MKKNIQISILAVTLSAFLISAPSTFASDYIDAGNGMVFFTDSTSEPKVEHQNSTKVRTSEKEGLSLDHIDAGNGMVFFTDSTPEPKSVMQSSKIQMDTSSKKDIVAIDDIAAGNGSVFY